MLEEIEPDIICIHNIQFQDIRVFVKYKKKNLGVKIFVDNHADYSNSARNWFSKNILYRFWWKPCAKAIEKHTEKFFGVMPSIINFLIDVYGISKDKCELLLMGADDEAIKHALNPAVKIAFRKKYGIKKNDLLIITGGKIDAFKSQTLLLMKAIKNINNEHVKLIVFGSVTEELKFSINELCDGNRIQYIGWAQGEQSYDFFASADLVVFPGRHSVL